MELQHLNVKIFAEAPADFEREKFTPIFQRWIQEQSIPGELLFDVAVYLHVAGGPGIVLVGHEADYSMDETGGRLGLRYNRKAKLDGDNRFRFSQALKAALQACLKLESENLLAGKLRFRRDEIELAVNDRALAPNLPETRTKHESELKAFFDEALGPKNYSMMFQEDPRERFGCRVTTLPFDFAVLIKKLS